MAWLTKARLLKIFENAIRESGWNFLHLCPFKDGIK